MISLFELRKILVCFFLFSSGSISFAASPLAVGGGGEAPGRVSEERPQDQRIESNLAVVVIDMQSHYAYRYGYMNHGWNRRILQKLLREQRKILSESIQLGLPILLVKYKHSEIRGKGLLCPQIYNLVKDYPKKWIVYKNKDNLFHAHGCSRAYTLKVLKTLSIDHLLIMGANAFACVRRSVFGALKAGFKVSLIPSSVADFNEKSFLWPCPLSSAYHLRINTRFVEYDSFKALRECVKFFSEDDEMSASDDE